MGDGFRCLISKWMMKYDALYRAHKSKKYIEKSRVFRWFLGGEILGGSLERFSRSADTTLRSRFELLGLPSCFFFLSLCFLMSIYMYVAYRPSHT